MHKRFEPAYRNTYQKVRLMAKEVVVEDSKRGRVIRPTQGRR